MSFVWNFLNWLQPHELRERREDGRVDVRNLAVFYFTGLKQKRSRVKDMSATGVFLYTDERWLPGACVLLTLRRTGLLRQRSGPPVRLRARSVRLEEDGVGLTFVPEPLSAAAWRNLMTKAAGLNARIPTAQDDIVGQFRVAKALAFLIRVSPSAEERILNLITEVMSDERAMRAIKVAVKAEELLDTQEGAAPGQVSPDLLLRALEVGSVAKDERTQQAWVGMLASSCRATADESSSWRCVNLLTQLLPEQIQILTLACTRATQLGWAPGFVFREKIDCPTDQIRRIAGIRDLAGVEQDLNHLHHLGLLEPTLRENAFEIIVNANITPTGLGLKLFARCSGYAEPAATIDVSALRMVS